MKHPPELEPLLAQRESVREKIADIEAAPRPYNEAEADLALIITAAASNVEAGMGIVAQGPGGWQEVLNTLTPAPAFLPGVSYPINTGDATFNLLCAIQPEPVMKWLRAELKRSYASLPPPLATSDKASRLKAAREELRAIEAKLAAGWWAAEAENVLLPVPADIDPATFLTATQPEGARP